MRYSVLTYLIGEGFSNVFKNKKQAAISLGTMCISMILFGVCFIGAQNINHFVKQVEAEQGIQVYILNDATEEEIEKLGEQIKAIQGVNTTEFISKEEALTQMKGKLGEKAYLLDGYEEVNIFPASYIVTLTDLKLSSNVQMEISDLENVKRITSSDETINTLIKIASGLKIATYVVIAGLTIFCVFIISNTIKLTVHARRKEISIMKYVGATNSFIRWPFAVEGIIIGLISGTVSIGILSGLYTLMGNTNGFVSFLAKLGLTLLNFSDMLDSIIIVYLILGVGIGIVGSSLSMRKYLKV